jgi:exopolyphosphatase / guanosine-5'-triphosphate,3'-diphosphate pyrophosphatase
MPTVAVVDLGSNSSRLLVAEVQDGRIVAERDRRSVVTRLGQGVDATGTLAPEAIDRVLAALDDFAPAIRAADRNVAVLTSAVRDASNGPEFTRTIAERYGLDARTLPGEEEARLSYLGATSARDTTEPTLVIDIGGGSTELIVGQGDELRAFVSLQMGVVRFSERHLHADPPEHDELVAFAEDARAVLDAGRPREAPSVAIAVAGTATQLARIDTRGEAESVHGHVLSLGRIEELLARLAQVDLEERRLTPGLDPARAPTIVAGAALLAEVLRAYGMQAAEVSEHDILRGAALAT